MSREITDTTNKYVDQDIPDGRRRFIVAGPVEKKYGKQGGEFFIWKVQWEGGIGQQVFLPNMMGGLLKVLGCQEIEPNKYDWDTNEQEGKAFYATVKHKPDKKDATKIRQHMGDFAIDEETEPPEPEEDAKDESQVPF